MTDQNKFDFDINKIDLDSVKDSKTVNFLTKVRAAQRPADKLIEKYGESHSKFHEIKKNVRELFDSSLEFSETLHSEELVHCCSQKDSLSLISEALSLVCKAHELVNRAHNRDHENAVKTYEIPEKEATVKDSSGRYFVSGLFGVNPRSGGGGGK
jgi:hypothetical protein